MTLVITILIFASAFIIRKPVNHTVYRIFQAIFNKIPFFRNQQILQRVEKPLGVITTALLWLLILYFMPQVWKSLGGIPLFLSRFLISGIQLCIKLAIGAALIWAAYNLVDLLVEYLSKRFVDENKHSSFKSHFIPFISHFTKIVVVLLGGLILLQNMGINVVSLMAGLGLGGIAIALAAKDSASNILSYINIMLDRPFSVGDWILCNDIEGTIVSVGLRSCKIKTFYDSIITIPNNTLATANIDNMGKRKARRTRVFLGVQYDTAPEKIEAFINGIKKVLLNNQAVKKDYFQVYFTEFGASELKIIINFFLLVSDWEHELKEKQNVFMEILKLAHREGVEFAFPTQTLHVDSLPENNPLYSSAKLLEKTKNTSVKNEKK